jgi:hypothetical protein
MDGEQIAGRAESPPEWFPRERERRATQAIEIENPHPSRQSKVSGTPMPTRCRPEPWPAQAGMAASTRVAAMVRAAVSALGSRSIQAPIPAPS